MPSHLFGRMAGVVLLTFLAGCATDPTGSTSTSSTSTSTGEGTSTQSEQRTDRASSERRAEPARETVAAETSRARETSETARSSRDSSDSSRDRDATSTRRPLPESLADRVAATPSTRASEGRSTFSASSLSTVNSSNAENAKLVAQLNEASRELASLRAANAKLSAERPRTTNTREASPKADPIDDKIAASVRSYGQFKQELSALMADAEKARSEHSSLNEKLKDAIARAEEARANLSRAENDLKKEKVARADAEQAAAKLREQLRTIARAVSGAGLNLDKIADGSATK
jgi:DNA repair exonuclease SbcCD ATPase subunit